MKRVYLMLLVSLMTLTVSASPVKKIPSFKAAENFAMASATTYGETEVSLSYAAAFMYANTSATLGDYFVILANVPCSYDSSTGEVKMDGEGWGLTLDFYGAQSSNPVTLPVGNYTRGNGTAAGTWNASYTSVAYLDELGTSHPAAIDDIQVSRTESGVTVIIVKASLDNVQYTFTYAGTPTFSGGEQSHSLAQITEDVNTTFTSGVAIYEGNLMKSDTGNMLVNLYDGEYDSEYGTMTGPGYHVTLNIFNSLFKDSKNAYVIEGTYTMAKNFQRFTYYPGIEVNYMGTTQILGCFVQKRDESGSYTSGCITSGTATIHLDVDGYGAENNVYTVTLDMMTDTGKKVQGTYTGKLPVTDASDDTSTKAVVSTLTQDYEMDLSQIPVARVYQVKDTVNCSHFVIDIGSVSGKDQCLVDNGGDYFRIDFLYEGGHTNFALGKYEAMEEKYYNFYQPNKLVWGHFENGGDLVGTRWGHFEPGRYLVMDGLAPIEKGYVTIQKNEDSTYTINIQCIDDAKNLVSGLWTGPLNYTYDDVEDHPENGIEDVTSQFSDVSSSLYNVAGQRVDKSAKGLVIQNGKKTVNF